MTYFIISVVKIRKKLSKRMKKINLHIEEEAISFDLDQTKAYCESDMAFHNWGEIKYTIS